MSVCLRLELPLPPSKNVAKVSKRRYVRRMRRVMSLKLNSEHTEQYRAKVAIVIRAELARRADVYFDHTQDLVVECYWRKPSDRYDCHNWHQEIADMLQVALGINDRRFLIRDMTQRVDRVNPGVLVELRQA